MARVKVVEETCNAPVVVTTNSTADVTHHPSFPLRPVRWHFQFPINAAILECNCSLCRMKGFLHMICKEGKFTLETPQASLTTYQFNTGVAKHKFCQTCGVQSFYHPRYVNASTCFDSFSLLCLCLRCLQQWSRTSCVSYLLCFHVTTAREPCRSHPDGISVNARCVDGGIPSRHPIENFDGQNWEASVANLRR